MTSTTVLPATNEGRIILLLVEDEAIIALALARTIRKFGYEVMIAGSGEDAIEKCTRNDGIRLILMDIDLGRGMDGPEAARRILSVRNLPIVFCTSHSEKEYVDSVREITRYGYVIKNSGDFVLRSSIEMAFELFDAHARVQANLNRISVEIGTIARRLEEAQAFSGGDPASVLEDALQGLLALVDSLRPA